MIPRTVRTTGRHLQARLAAVLPNRPRRSLLYVPASSEKMLRKASTLKCDSVCLDLEDGVAASAKDSARELLRTWLPQLDFVAGEVLVRVNNEDDDILRADIDDILANPALPNGIVLPKTESASQLNFVERKLERAAQKALDKNDVERADRLNSMVLVGMVESPKALLDCAAIAQAAPGRLKALIFGGDDFAAASNMRRSADNAELAVPRALFQMHCAAAGVQAIDIVNIEFRNAAKLSAECLTAAGQGFAGKQLIHPAQIDVANEAFAPPADKIEWASRVVEAFKKHETEGTGAFDLDGQMIDMPTVRQAQFLLDTAALL